MSPAHTAATADAAPLAVPADLDVPAPREAHGPGRHHAPEEDAPRVLTLVDSGGHFCDTWQQREGDIDYTCACEPRRVVPAEDRSAAKVRAVHYLMQREPMDDVITWATPEYETLADPDDPTYISDRFWYSSASGVWVSVDAVMIPDSRFAEAKALAAQHPEAPQVPLSAPGRSAADAASVPPT